MTINDEGLARRLAALYNQFVIRGAERDALQAHLKGRGVGSEVYDSLPPHPPSRFADLGYKKGTFPVREKLAPESRPVRFTPHSTGEDIDYIVESIRSFYAGPPSR